MYFKQPQRGKTTCFQGIFLFFLNLLINWEYIPRLMTIMTSPHDLRKGDVTDLFVLVRVKLWDLWLSREMTTACDEMANKLSVKTTLTLAVLNSLVSVAMTWSPIRPTDTWVCLSVNSQTKGSYYGSKGYAVLYERNYYNQHANCKFKHWIEKRGAKRSKQSEKNLISFYFSPLWFIPVVLFFLFWKRNKYLQL